MYKQFIDSFKIGSVNKFISTFVLALCLFFNTKAFSQFEIKSIQPNECDTTIWFVNIYPGAEIYELEGHSALRIKTCDYDLAVHYGLFDFNSPNFVYRFVKGETDYMVGALPWQLFMEEYTSHERRVVAHKLNLTSAQKELLIDRLSQNLKPENRQYRYNYVYDNCATRPLKIVESSVGDTIILGEAESVVGETSFRNIMRHYHKNYPWYQFGIDLILGNGIDKTITNREKSFAPVVLDQQLLDATIGTSDKKLVVESDVLSDFPAEHAVLPSTPWYFSPFFVCWMLCIVLSVYSLFMVLKLKRYPRWLLSIIMILNGIVGLLIAFMVFISTHEASSPNLNLLWLNPLYFIPAVTLWFKFVRKINFYFFLIIFVLLFAVLVLWISGYQSPNPAFIPLVLTELLLTGLFLFQNRRICEKN